jgi:peptide/nickel transport system permease protein
MMPAGLAAFTARRLVAAVVLVVVVSSSALLLVRLAPGDATTELALAHVDAAALAEARTRLGLDRPFSAQLGSWIRGLAHFDLGQSSRFGRPVADLVGERSWNTARLAAVALALAVLIGLPLGLLTGAAPRGLLAMCVTPVSIALLSCPPIVGAFGLMVLAINTRWLSIVPGAVVVPALALALPLAAMLERVQSQATTEVLAAPGAGAAAARGLPPWRLLWIHAARQAVRPVLGLFGVILGSLFSGSLAVEWVTSWPGLGRLMYDGLVGRDLFLVAGCALVGAVLIAIGNLAADLLRGLADPRVRVS